MRTAAAALAFLALTACGSSGGAPVATPTSAQASPTQTSQAAAWTIKDAAARYTDMVKPLNAANDDLRRAAASASVTVNDLARSCRAVAAATDTLIADLRAGSWPAQAQSDVDALLAAATKYAEAHKKCASGRTSEAVEQGFADARESGVGPAVAALRAALGLPTATPS